LQAIADTDAVFRAGIAGLPDQSINLTIAAFANGFAATELYTESGLSPAFLQICLEVVS
jgi:hypothetical protein